MFKNRSNSGKEGTRRVSLIVRWVSIVAMTIAVSFLVFSAVVYNTVRQESLNQQQDTADEIVQVLRKRLVGIDSELEIANVVQQLSPNTRRILKGGPTFSDNNNTTSTFSDSVLSTVTNPDVTVAIYNLRNEIVFHNGESTPKLVKFSDEQKSVVKENSKGQSILYVYRKVRSRKTGKLTGYIVVKNAMTAYNRLIRRTLSIMLWLSILAVVLAIIVSYLVVRSVVKPIKTMSKVAREVNDDPNSTARIPELNRNDELEELALSFNMMLDRMQKYIEQQKQFVSDVSHELRTPVAVIEGHLSMLKRWGKDDPQILEESIDASISEAERMKHLIQEMLDLTRAEQISVHYPNAIAEPMEVLTRVVGDMGMVHPDFKIGLEVEDLDPDTKIQIYQGHLEQILIILIDNGIKYSTDRKEILVSAGQSGQEMQIVVQDYGEGISDEDKKKIFNRFYRVDKARTREKGGNGLGLSIAQKLVESYHGTIDVESVLGQGSQFRITFPVLTDEDVERLEKRQEEKEAEGNDEKPAALPEGISKD